MCATPLEQYAPRKAQARERTLLNLEVAPGAHRRCEWSIAAFNIRVRLMSGLPSSFVCEEDTLLPLESGRPFLHR